VTDVLKRLRAEIPDVRARTGIDRLIPKRAATGDLLLEIPGSDASRKADALAALMRDCIGGMEGVKITRPVRRVDLRVIGFDDSIAPREIAEAISATMRAVRATSHPGCQEWFVHRMGTSPCYCGGAGCGGQKYCHRWLGQCEGGHAQGQTTSLLQMFGPPATCSGVVPVQRTDHAAATIVAARDILRRSAAQGRIVWRAQSKGRVLPIALVRRDAPRLSHFGWCLGGGRAPPPDRAHGAREGELQEGAGGATVATARSSSADTVVLPGRAGEGVASQGSSPLSPPHKKARATVEASTSWEEPKPQRPPRPGTSRRVESPPGDEMDVVRDSDGGLTDVGRMFDASSQASG